MHPSASESVRVAALRVDSDRAGAAQPRVAAGRTNRPAAWSAPAEVRGQLKTFEPQTGSAPDAGPAPP